MATAELQNANPTILSSAQLPSRRKQKQAADRRGPEFKYDAVLSSTLTGGLWGLSRTTSSWPSDEEDDDDAFTEEPIDEQEIYGMFRLKPHISHALLRLYE